MKVRKTVVIACNKCEATFESTAHTVREAREQAHKQGWTASGSRVDHCPEHAGAPAKHRKARAARKEAREKTVAEARATVVIDLHKQGIAANEIASAVGVSRQRVYQILEEVGVER